MKIKINLLFLLTFLTLLSGCVQKGSQEKKPAYVTFQVPSNKISSFFVIRLDSLGNEYRKEIRINGPGTGTCTLQLDKPEEIIIEPTGFQKKLRLYVNSNDSIIVKANFNNENFFRITGTHAPLQQFLLKSDIELHSAHINLISHNSEKFDSALEAFYHTSILELDQFASVNSIDANFVEDQKLTIWSNTIYALINKRLSHTSREIPNTLGFKDSLQHFNNRRTGNFAYISLLHNFGYTLANLVLADHPVLAADYDRNLAMTVDSIQKMDLHPYLQQWMEAIIIANIQDLGMEGPLGERYQMVIDKQDYNEGLKKYLRNVAAVWKNIQPGLQAPDFKALTTSGDTISISQYFGKPIYIDIWTSWCGPCLAEFPFSRKMMNDPQMENLEYIFISIDYTEKEWLKGLEKHSMPGVQLYAPGNWESELAKLYHITGLPRYMIIDSSGKIIRVNAPKPSSLEDIKEIMKNLAAD